jgi:uncharacterized protein (DUF1499 family)
MLVGAVLAWLRLIPALAGFALYALGGFLCVAAAVAALRGLVAGRGLRPGGIVAIAATALLVFGMLRGAGLPRINDFTTDLADPPAFTHAQKLPPNAGRSLEYPPAFAAEQRTCCADLQPVHLAMAPAEAFPHAQAVATAMPAWEIMFSDPATGMIEAVATSTVFGFQDDVAIRVRPDPAGSGSIVDMRSKSRDGKGDLGANANRIRAFVTRLQQGG